MVRLSFGPLFVLIVSAATCTSSGVSDDGISRELKRIEFADPAADLELAMENGDCRFIGIMGYALEVPGKYWRSSYGVRVIEGTSDVIISPEYGRLLGIARRYAERYNQLLLEKIEKIEQGGGQGKTCVLRR